MASLLSLLAVFMVALWMPVSYSQRWVIYFLFLYGGRTIFLAWLSLRLEESADRMAESRAVPGAMLSLLKRLCRNAPPSMMGRRPALERRVRELETQNQAQ